jgi:hypothetical protein
MHFHVYLDQELGEEVRIICQKTHKKRNAVVREALRLYIHQQKKKTWPDSILAFRGIKDFPAFESYRKDLGQDLRTTFLD